MKTKLFLPPVLLALAACSGTQPVMPDVEPSNNDGVFVQMFEWRWTDLARECEEHLGPAATGAHSRPAVVDALPARQLPRRKS